MSVFFLQPAPPQDSCLECAGGDFCMASVYLFDTLRHPFGCRPTKSVSNHITSSPWIAAAAAAASPINNQDEQANLYTYYIKFF